MSVFKRYKGAESKLHTEIQQAKWWRTPPRWQETYKKFEASNKTEVE